MSKRTLRKNGWTTEEVQFLKENYTTSKGSEIASVLGKSKAAVYARANSLNLVKTSTKAKRKHDQRANICKANSTAPRWTSSDVNFLRENMGKLSDKEISEKLGKTIPAVYCKRRSLKTVKNLRPAPDPKVEIKTDNRFKAWSKEDEKALKSKFNNIPVEELAKELKRTVSSVNCRARALGLLVPTETNVQRASWSDEEIKYLKKNINKKSFEQIGEYLGRSVASVQCKASSLKIKKAFPMRKKAQINVAKIAIGASIAANIGLVTYLIITLI